MRRHPERLGLAPEVSREAQEHGRSSFASSSEESEASRIIREAKYISPVSGFSRHLAVGAERRAVSGEARHAEGYFGSASSL